MGHDLGLAYMCRRFVRETKLGRVLDIANIPLVSNVRGLYRFAVGLDTFLRHPISLEEARAIVEHGMQHREAALLRKLEGAVFGNPRSPYLALFRNAGCTWEDAKDAVAKDGVEGALARFLKAGIYVSFEELKGRTPAVRGSQTFSFRDSDFDNPLIVPHFESGSGGTRGRPSRIRVDLEHAAQVAPHWALWFAAHDWLDRPLVFWTPPHSGVVGRHLLAAKFGKRFIKWFATVGMGTLKDRLISTCVHGLARRAAGWPRPEFVPLSEAFRVGEYLVALVRRGHKPCINTSPSEAIQACLAMAARGISLEHITFLLGAEPLTPARRATIEASGAKAVPTYGFSEGSNVGSQCPTATVADDVHVSLDAWAILPSARLLAEEETVDSLLLTGFRPACPKVLVNAEIGDYAVLETRRCGCLFDEVGYYTHLHTIRSFEKLTGIGMTILGGDLFRVLEERVRPRFGGAVTDYQLIEEQDAAGLPRYSLLVSPDVGPLDESRLVETFLDELGALRSHYRFMTNLWAEAGVVRVQRRRPVATARGKVLPFRTLGPR